MLWPQFVGAAYQTRSINIDAEAAINLFLETVESPGSPKRSNLYGTPGLQVVTTATDTICRGMFAQDGRQFAVIGPRLYELQLSGSGSTLVAQLVNRGTLASDGTPVFFASNGKGGNQLAISSAGNLYIFNLSTNALSAAIVLPLTNAAGQVGFVNSYFVLHEKNTLKMWFSIFEDGTTWDALDFFTRSNVSDNIVGFAILNDLIRVFGSKTSELWYNVGVADNPFLPFPNSQVTEGAVAATGIGVLAESMVWVSKNERNVVRVMQAGTGAAHVISTPPVEVALASYTSVTDVELLTYEQEGHPFACWSFPTADVTWCWDARESAWHQRARWDPTASLFHVWQARGTCAPGSQVVLAGDRTLGTIYQLSLDTFTDNCVAMRRLRRAPYPSAENQWVFLDQIELGVQSGVGLASGTGVNANVLLRLSRDSGNTYSTSTTASMGTRNSFLARAVWRRQGRVREDRLVVEVSMTDPVRAVWGPGIWLRTTPGSGAL